METEFEFTTYQIMIYNEYFCGTLMFIHFYTHDI
jgi:hypothetical protein